MNNKAICLSATAIVTAAFLAACNSSPEPISIQSLGQNGGTLSVQAAPVNVLPRSGWTVRSSSPSANNAATILDGSETTAWTSSAVQTNGLYLQIDLGAVRNFDKIVLEAGAGSQNFLRSYNVYLSSVDNDWGPLLTSGDGNTTTRLEIPLGARSGRYLTIQSGYDTPGKPWGLAELWLTSAVVPPPPPAPTGTRDPWLKPFSANSIWNTPIGAGAAYVLPGHFKPLVASNEFNPGTAHTADTEYYFKLKPSDPVKQVYGVPNWTDRCADLSRPQTNNDGTPVDRKSVV